MNMNEQIQNGGFNQPGMQPINNPINQGNAVQPIAPTSAIQPTEPAQAEQKKPAGKKIVLDHDPIIDPEKLKAAMSSIKPVQEEKKEVELPKEQTGNITF